MRSLALLALLTIPACGFTARTLEDGVPGDDTADPPPPGDPTARRCNVNDPALRLCIDFDDEQALTSDGSGRGHDAIGTGLTVMTRENEQAVLVGATSQLVVPESLDLDIKTNLTVTLYANPASAPRPGKSYWALDNNKQYFVSYKDDGKFRCGIGAMTVDSAVGVLPGDWYHVACTYDRGELRLFIDGQLAGCRLVPPSIPTDGGEGLAIGGNVGANQAFTDQFVGGLDNVQVFERTYTMDEVCSAAGETDCWQGITGTRADCE